MIEIITVTPNPAAAGVSITIAPSGSNPSLAQENYQNRMHEYCDHANLFILILFDFLP